MAGRRGRTVINEILAEMARRGPKVQTSDQLAKALKLDPARVRDSLQNYSRNYPQGPVKRISTGVFEWRDVGDAPTSGAPVNASVEPSYKNEAVDGMKTFGDTLTEDEKQKFHDAMMDNIPTQPTVLDHREGLMLEGARFSAKVISVQGEGDDTCVYFLHGGKVWKAYAV